MKLIDGDKLKIALCNICRPFDGLCAKGTCTAINVINQVPTADAVPVVRCKDCIHNRKPDGWCAVMCGFCGDDEWYCASGERKEG